MSAGTSIDQAGIGRLARMEGRSLLDGALRVYVASEVRLCREGLAHTLTQHGQLGVVGAGGHEQVLRDLATLRPDVLLLDLTARGSLFVPSQAVGLVPELRVVAFAVAEVETDVLACAAAGICGYVAQDGTVEDLVAAVLGAISDELICSPRIAGMLFRQVASLSAARRMPHADPALTAREEEIARLVARGLSNKSIARELRLAPATIKNHVHNILQKLGLQRRSEIAASGLRLPARTLRQ